MTRTKRIARAAAVVVGIAVADALFLFLIFNAPLLRWLGWGS